MTSRILIVVVAMSLAGCTQTARIAVLSADGFYDPEANGATLLLRSDLTLERYKQNVRPAEAVIYICGQFDRFNVASRLMETSSPHVYSAAFPSLSRRAVWQSDGRVDEGWPEELARDNGICVRVEASEMLWLTLASNEVVVPR